MSTPDLSAASSAASSATSSTAVPGPDRMVSVNDYGASSSGWGYKLAIACLVVIIALVGIAFSVNRYVTQARAKAEQSAAQEQQARTSPASAHRRQLGTADSAPARPLPAAASAIMGTECSDHSVPQAMLDRDGMPLLAPNGLAVRLCANGQVLVPPMAPPEARTTANSATNTGAGASAGNSTRAAPRRGSRYDGELLLPAPDGSSQAAASAALLPVAATGSAGPAPTPTNGERNGSGALAPPADPRGPVRAMLRGGRDQTAHASLLGNRDLILPEGRSIDCNLSLRVISDISGKAVCVLSSYVYGDSGVVVLAEPGSIATGDYLALSVAGQRRLFITWTRLKTAQGAVVEIDSPASDALGTSGLEGYLDNRWGDRIGAAVLLSLVQDAIGYETARASAGGNGGGGVAVFQQTTQAGRQLAERILDSTINIKPTLYKHQGDRASITVARDLDFGAVYVLHTK